MVGESTGCSIEVEGAAQTLGDHAEDEYLGERAGDRERGAGFFATKAGEGEMV
ncbi:MAG: hypothetical protein J6386_04505 [Candidatus Synoicihabitans palmerolidicus]|nr:hypothetical protein [Candidatus Synoicihabitans palmerolidicus]